MKKGAVIVESRFLPNLKEIIQNHFNYLDNSWGFTFFGSVLNKKFILSNFPKCNFIDLGSSIFSISQYNRLLTTKQFWEKIPYDKILIFQHDSRLLRSGIDEFMEWDYIGAPWAQIDLDGGNGGLSLRSKKKMIEAIDHIPFNSDIHINEDMYFCSVLPFINARIPDKETGKRFSVESIFYENPLGIHAPEKYLNPVLIKKLMNKKSDHKINLITNFYVDKNKERQSELDMSLRNNLSQYLFSKIFLIISEKDKEYLLDNHAIDDRVEIIINNDRPTYNDFFGYSKPDTISIISNSDILFKEEELRKIDKYDWKNNKKKCFALARWNINDLKKFQSELYDVSFSQDTWIFYGKIPYMSEANFPLGIIGCDNRIAYVIHKNGYNISNPSKDIKTYHLHLSGIKNYSIANRIPPPHLYPIINDINRKDPDNDDIIIKYK